MLTNKINRTIVITGAASGLGRALSVEFFKRGYNLALIDIDDDGLKSVQYELTNEEQKITVHHADISDEQSIVATRLEILKSHPIIYMLVNNAGISASRFFEQVELSDYKKIFDTNFWGTVYCTKHFLADLKNQDDSRLVNVISSFALIGFPGKTAYASSKAAIMAFSNSIKTELVDTCVSVCLVIPPPLDTGLIKNGQHIDDNKKAREILFLKRTGMPLNYAAIHIVTKIEQGKYRIVVGMRMFWIDLFSRLFPTLTHTLIARNKKRIDFV